MPSTEQPLGSPTKSALNGSPRSSVESGAGGHSPFLQSLHQRFRKSSSGASAQSDQTVPPTDTKSRNDASKEAKRYLLSVVRDDWEYPSLPVKRPYTPTSKEPVSYCRREDGLSDVESDNSPHKRRSRNDPYKFENPEAVADYVNERRAKRRRLIQEELSWNLGLKNWTHQRDAWTGAVKQNPLHVSSDINTHADTKPQLSSTLHQRSTSDSTTDDSINWPLSPHSPTPENSSSIDSVDFQQPHSSKLPGLPQFSNSTSKPLTQTPPATDYSISSEPYLPIYAPLFPATHILRSRISPPAYPTIYSKVVLQSLAPNIPIPLTDMTRALVQGWKTEGNWPSGATQNPAGQAGTLVDAKAAGGRLKESAFSRWRREHAHKNLGLPESVSHQRGGSSTQNHGPARGHRKSNSTKTADALAFDNLNLTNGSERQGRVRKSISVVKRAILGTEDNIPEVEKLANGEVPDIGIDFEEQEAQDAEADERDRVLNRGLLDVGDERKRSKG